MSGLVDEIKTDKVKSTPLGGKVWISAIVFGLVGQIAWVIENMYFATFAQDLFEDATKFGNLYYVSTTLMVIFSAIVATATTIFAGGILDKVGKRKPFIAYGYIAWGVTIMLFAAIPVDFDATAGIGIVAMLVIFDCVMTFFGSTANDAAFNTWVADVTDTTNRGKVNTILSLMPVFAMVLAIVVAMFTFDKGGDRVDAITGDFIKGDPFMYKLFFIILGIIPMVSGVLAVFTMKDSPNIIKNQNPDYLKETFYGFRPEVIKDNKLMYVTLSAMCILGIAQQTFMSYLINFIEKTLGITNYILPLGIIIVGAAILTGLGGVLFDKFGRKHTYFPLLTLIVVGALIIYLMEFMPKSSYETILIVLGIVLMGGILCMGGALASSFQDYIPKGYEGRFQGVRMCFTVLVPMIIGPIISLAIGINSFDPLDPVAKNQPPFLLFLAAAIIAVFAAVPIFFIRKDADRLRSVLVKERDIKLESEAAGAAVAAKESTLGEPQPQDDENK